MTSLNLFEKLKNMITGQKENVGSTENSKHIYRGSVKWFSLEKGYGFIAREGNQGDCFVHLNAILGPIRPLREGEKVEFEIEKTEKGDRAVRVHSLEHGNKLK